MWQFHLIDNYDGGSALVMRMHHSYADGIALVRVMLSMTDATANGPPAMPFAPQPRTAHANRTIRSAICCRRCRDVMKHGEGDRLDADRTGRRDLGRSRQG